MIAVGVKSGAWKYITDGVFIYTAERDVRYYSQPPGFWVDRDGTKVVESDSGENRITKVSMSFEQFRAHCQKEGIELRGSVTVSDKLGKAAGPATIGGGIGALIGGPVGAAIGVGVMGWLASSSDFEPKNLRSVLARVMEGYAAWQQFDSELRVADAKAAAEYEAKARDNWRRYHRLRNLSSVDELDGLEFEVAVSILYEKKGYKVQLTKASGDFGVDLLAEKGQERIAVQAKRYSGTVGVKAVQEVAAGGFYYKATKAVVVTNSYYTPAAKKMAGELGVELVNRKRLALMWDHVHPDGSVPEFDLATYKQKEREIRRELSHADFSARTDKSRRRWR